jgi:hypothetical protein
MVIFGSRRLQPALAQVENLCQHLKANWCEKLKRGGGTLVPLPLSSSGGCKTAYFILSRTPELNCRRWCDAGLDSKRHSISTSLQKTTFCHSEPSEESLFL